MFCFIVFLLLVGAGFYFYQKLRAIEAEIRAERKDESVHCPVSQGSVAANAEKNVFEAEATVVVSEAKPKVDSKSINAEIAGNEAAIIAVVKKQAGMKQTELYTLLADINKKQLQQTVKDMADNGVLRREKKGSSYLLYIA